jgi:TPR repeat protein
MGHLVDVDVCAIGDDFYFRQRDFVKAVKCYHMAATKNDPSALYMLGICYYNGQGVAIDRKRAITHWQHAIENGDSIYSPYELACCYFIGEDIPENEEEAFRLWMMSANKGHKHSMIEVGNSYFHGTGIARDLSRANSYWMKASKVE